MDTLQHWDGCAEMVISDGPVKVAGVCLMDERDGKTYEVRRLNDGQCWQVDNLAYGGDKVTGAADVCLENEGTFTGAVSEYADGSGKGYTRTDIFGPGTYGNCGIWTMDTAIVDRYGYYYDWAAAMQDPEAYDKNYAYQQKAEPRQGICPEGWHLPQENDFSDVINKSAATGKNFNIDQFKIAYAGVYDSSLDGKYYTQGNAANYWTSTYWHQVGAGYDNTLGRAYGWSRFINSYVGNSVAGLSDGLTVRCVKN